MKKSLINAWVNNAERLFLVWSLVFILGGSLSFAAPKPAAKVSVKSANRKNLLRVENEKAKENIATVFKDVPLDEKRKKFLEEEVVAYALLFNDRAEGPSLSKLQSYISFSADGLIPVEENGKTSVPLCFAVYAPESCADCKAFQQFLFKYLVTRLQKRGFDPRRLHDLEETFVAGLSAQPDVKVSLASRRAYESFLDQATRQGCEHSLYVGMDEQGEKIHSAFYIDVKDIGKRRHSAQYEVSEPKSSTKAAEEGLFTSNTTVLVRATGSLFTALGDIKGVYSQSIGAVSKRLSLEGKFSFDAYNLFKRKLLESVVGLTSLEEKLMTSGKIIFVVKGDVSLALINNQIVEVMGATPTIVSHELLDENLLRVVIR